MMKTFILVILFFGMAIVFVKAQSNFGAGIKAGMNISNQVPIGKTYSDTHWFPILAFHCGVHGNYFLNEDIAVQAELMYSQKGSLWFDDWDLYLDKVGYLDVPILFRYQLIDQLNFHAGPHFGFLLHASQDEVGWDYDDNINDYYKSMEVALGFGAEANLKYNINLTARYIFGLHDATTDMGYCGRWRNNVFQLSLGYRFMGK